LRNVVWNEEEFPGLSHTTHDTVPERFGQLAKPGDAEHSPDDEEDSDSTDSEGVTILPPFELAVPPSDSNSSSSSLGLSSMASPSSSPPQTPPRPAPGGPPRTPPQDAVPGLPSAPEPATRIAPQPAPPRQPLPTPAARASAPASVPAHAVEEPEAVSPRQSARSNAGVALPENWYNTMAQLQGKVRGVPVASSCETATRASSCGGIDVLRGSQWQWPGTLGCSSSSVPPDGLQRGSYD
jgi:hypothetical protein